MTYRSMLVLLDHDPSLASRVRVAVQLAKGFDCHLVGLAPTGLIDLPRGAEGTAALAQQAALTRDRLRDWAELATQTFRDARQMVNLTSHEVVIDEDEPARSVVRHGHFSDLIVLSQIAPRLGHTAQALSDIQEVVLASPHPALVLPADGTIATVGTRVLVAWNDTREAIRAIDDALPLLRQAAHIDVLAWKEPGADVEHGLAERMDSLHQWLLWQGVSAETRLEATTLPVATQMLARARELGSDLLVMGACGHARWAERTLGGTTRGILAGMTVPVLLSH